MKSVFMVFLLLSCAQRNKIHLFGAGSLQALSHGIHSTSCCIYIINHQYGKSPDIFLCAESICKILLSLSCIQLFLGFCIAGLFYQSISHRDLKLFSHSVSQICRLIKTSHTLLPACKGNWYDHIRLPSHNVFSCVFTDCIRIIIPVFPAAIIFVSHKRLPELSIINKNRSSLIKAAAKRRAFPAVFFLLFYRLSAFQTIILSDPAKYSFTLRTDQRFLIFQYSVTHRAVPGIKDIQKHIYIFIQKQSFLPDEKGIYSSSFNLISREL